MGVTLIEGCASAYAHNPEMTATKVIADDEIQAELFLKGNSLERVGVVDPLWK